LNVVSKLSSLAIEVNKYPVMPDITPYRHQTHIRMTIRMNVVFVATKKVRSSQEFPTQTITPGMIGTDDGATPSAFHIDKLCTPMPTNIVKCPNFGVIAPHQYYRLSCYLYRKQVTRIRNLMSEGGEYPRILKNSFLLQAKKIRVGIRLIRQHRAFYIQPVMPHVGTLAKTPKRFFFNAGPFLQNRFIYLF
jgi:hypothetical protein